MTMRIDTHVHIFPDEASEDPVAFAERYGEHHWLSLVAPKDRPSIQGWADPETCLRHMDAAGIDRVILQGWYWEHAETCAMHNRIYADILKRWPDRFSAFASFHSQMLQENPDIVETLGGMGFCGLGELLPQVQGYAILGDTFAELMHKTTQAGFWVNFHATEPVGAKYPGRVDTPLQDFLDLAKNHPNQRIILSHLGGGLAFFAQNPSARKRSANLYFDTAAWPLIYSENALAAAINLARPKAIFYGTDYPLRSFPKQGLDRQMQLNLDVFEGVSGISEDDFERILSNGRYIPEPA